MKSIPIVILGLLATVGAASGKGVLDTTMDEVVVVQGIERLGPKVTRSYVSG